MRLRLDEVSHRFGRDAAWCLRGVSLAVDPGEVVGLVGPSGAGKSVLLRVACGLLRPTAGRVIRDGDAAAIGYVAPSHRCPDGITARAWLDAMAALHRRGDDDVEAALDLTDLGPLADTPGRALSLGERRRLELARALLHDPALLVLDDPALGLDPTARADLTGFLQTLASLGKSVLVASSQPELFAPVCTRVLALGADHRLAAAERL